MRTSIKKNLFCAMVLAIVLFILFHQSLFLGKGLVPADGIFLFAPWQGQEERPISNWLLKDQYLNFIPQHHLFHTEALKGNLPLWNPYLSCGMPALASIQTAALSPVNLAFSFLEPFRSAGFKAFFKLFLAGFFMILYMKRLGVGQWAALLSSLAFSLCSFMIVWLGHPHTNCAMWLPLLLYFIEGEFRETENTPATAAGSLRASLRCWAGFSIAYGLMLLGGHPPTIIHISVFAGVYFCFRVIVSRRQGHAGRRILFFFSGILAGLLLAAPQLLPFFEYYCQSSSSLSYAAIGRSLGRLHPHSLTYYLMPYICGSPATGFEWLQSLLGEVSNFNERTGFVGIIPLYLSLIAVLYRRNKFVIFYFVSILFCLCVIFGLPPILAIIRYIPLVGSISHRRLILFVCFSLAVLAGFGLEGLFRIKTAARWKVLAGVWALAAGFVFWIGLVFKPVLTGNDQLARLFVVCQLMIFCAALIVATVVTVYAGRSGRVLAKALALGWLCFELLWFAMDYNPSIRRQDYYPKTAGIRFLQQDDSLFRVASADWVLPANTAAMYGLYDVRGQDFMTVRRYEELITGSAGDFWFYSPQSLLPPCPCLLNVKYLLTDKDKILPLERVYQGEISIYRNEPFIDRAIVVYDYEVLPEKESILEIVRSEDFDPRKRLLLERQPELPDRRGEPAADVAEPNVCIVDYGTDEVTIEASTPRAGFLVLLDTYFPGWRAFVDNKETRIYRADYNFRVVALPAGISTVRFVYKPASFSIGCSLSLACAVLLACVVFYRR